MIQEHSLEHIECIPWKRLGSAPGAPWACFIPLGAICERSIWGHWEHLRGALGAPCRRSGGVSLVRTRGALRSLPARRERRRRRRRN
eukprot:608145-Pyramimonas_sp.AAC.1